MLANKIEKIDGLDASVRFSAVTMIYDIGRASKDGRTIKDYVTWLNITLQLPITFTVFLDPTIDASLVKLKQEDRLLQLPFAELYPYRWREKVEAICLDKGRMQASEDLTYRLPAYALVQFAKFDVLSRATELHPDATHIFWIDAGLSRFLGESSEVSFAYEPWLPSSGSVFLAITPRLLEDLRKGSPVLYAGTCERLVTGEMFMLRSNKAKDIARRVYGYVESEWLAHDKWDNEQVALGEILSRDPAFAVIVDASGEQAKFAKLVFPRKHLRVFSTFLSVITRLIGFLKR